MSLFKKRKASPGQPLRKTAGLSLSDVQEEESVLTPQAKKEAVGGLVSSTTVEKKSRGNLCF